MITSAIVGKQLRHQYGVLGPQSADRIQLYERADLLERHPLLVDHGKILLQKARAETSSLFQRLRHDLADGYVAYRRSLYTRPMITLLLSAVAFSLKVLALCALWSLMKRTYAKIHRRMQPVQPIFWQRAYPTPYAVYSGPWSSPAILSSPFASVSS